MYEPICMHCKYYVIHILYWFWEVHKQHFGKRLQKFRGLTIFYNRNIWNGFHLVTFWVVWRIFAVISNILLAGVDSSKKSTPIRLGVTPIFPTHSWKLIENLSIWRKIDFPISLIHTSIHHIHTESDSISVKKNHQTQEMINSGNSILWNAYLVSISKIPYVHKFDEILHSI